MRSSTAYGSCGCSSAATWTSSRSRTPPSSGRRTDSPFQTVATIHAGPQDSWSQEQVQKVNEEMRFSPWIGLAAHRPLGNINRARKEPYEHSANYRARFNRCPIHEPTSADA